MRLPGSRGEGAGAERANFRRCADRRHGRGTDLRRAGNQAAGGGPASGHDRRQPAHVPRRDEAYTLDRWRCTDGGRGQGASRSPAPSGWTRFSGATEVTVTERGRPVARLFPASGPSAYERLVARAVITPARRPKRPKSSTATSRRLGSDLRYRARAAAVNAYFDTSALLKLFVAQEAGSDLGQGHVGVHRRAVTSSGQPTSRHRAALAAAARAGRVADAQRRGGRRALEGFFQAMEVIEVTPDNRAGRRRPRRARTVSAGTTPFTCLVADARP